MLAALLLAACLARASPDWVEISQQHYRKPARTHTFAQHQHVQPTFYPTEEEMRLTHNFPIEDIRRAPSLNPTRLTPTQIKNEVRLVENNVHKGDRIYLNNSISEHNWNQDIHRVPDVKRIEANNFKIKANVTPKFSLDIYEQVTEKPELVIRSSLKDQASVSATIERVPNKGSVKRVQLSNTPVKSPSITKAVSPIRRSDIRQFGSPPMNSDFSDEFEITPDMFKKAHEEVIALTPLNRVNVFSSTKETPVRNDDGVITSTSWPNGEPTMFHIHPQTQQSETIVKTGNNEKNGANITTIQNNSAFKENSGSNTNNKDLQTEPLGTMKTNKDKNEMTHIVPNKVPAKHNIKENTISSSINKNKSNIDVNTQFTRDQNTRHDSGTNSVAGENKRNEEVEANTMENLMKFMKVVADTISKNTRRGVNGKVKYLNDLKETLLSSIKERIEATWPDDTSAPARRRSRSATARGHVEFPSSESALMTISFLTFAVFLIKLVLQVIHTYKNKAMMVAPLVVAGAGRTARRLRDFH